MNALATEGRNAPAVKKAGPTRIANKSLGPVSKEAALLLLRTKCLPNTDGVYPGLELLGALMAAYPEARLPPDESGAPPAVDWQDLAWRLAIDFVPAFEGVLAPGRPVKSSQEIVATIDAMVKSGEAKNITHASSMAERRKLFPGITEVRKAYYRELKKLSRKT